MHYWEEFLLWIINCFGPWSANHWVEPQQQCQDYYLWPTSSKGNKLERVNSLFHFMKWHENDTFCEALCGWYVGPKLSNNAVATIALLSSPPYAQQNTAHYALTHCSLNTWHAHTQLNIEAGTFCEHVCDQVKVCVVYFLVAAAVQRPPLGWMSHHRVKRLAVYTKLHARGVKSWSAPCVALTPGKKLSVYTKQWAGQGGI